MTRHRLPGRSPGEMFWRVVGSLRHALVCLAWCSGGVVVLDYFPPPDPVLPPDPDTLDQPPPGHPERLASEQPLSPAEAGLWQQILSDDPAA